MWRRRTLDEIDVPSRPFTLAIASGKGGTGKTMIATSLAVLEARRGARVVLTDCDVEAPNDALFFADVPHDIEPVTMPLAEVDSERCTACGECSKACAYGGIRVLGSSAVVFEELCHGCGLCERVCPESAIGSRDLHVGEVRVSDAVGVEGLTLVSGVLDVGQTKTPEVIRATRRAAERIDADVVILDAPPGVACGAVASLKDADAVLLVTEPTPFGIHDLRLAAELACGLELPAGVIINRSGSTTIEIEKQCDIWQVPVIAQIPFSREVAEAYATGRLIVDAIPQADEWLSYVLATMRAQKVEPQNIDLIPAEMLAV